MADTENNCDLLNWCPEWEHVFEFDTSPQGWQSAAIAPWIDQDGFVYAAGDGVLKYRTKSRDAYYLAENTFQFDSVKRKVGRGLRRANFHQPPRLGVRIITSQYPNGFFYALQDEALAADLFQTAFKAGLHDLAQDRRSTRLRRMYRFHPPIPKE